MKRRTYVLVAAVVLIAVVGAYFSGALLAVGVLPADTTSHYYATDGFDYRGWYNGNSEILDATRYTTSIDPNLLSEKISAQYQWCNGYTVWAIEDSSQSGDPWAGTAFRFEYSLNGAVKFNLAYSTAQIYGSGARISALCGQAWESVPVDALWYGEAVGAMTVKIFEHHTNKFNGGDQHWAQVAQDGADLVSGRGTCQVSNIPTANGYQIPYKPGDTVKMLCQLGYSQSAKEGVTGGTWKLFGDWNSGAQLANLGPGPASNVVGSFVAPNVTGLRTVTLYNSLWPYYTSHFTITINPLQAPPPPDFTLSPSGPWTTNQTITLSWQAKSNPTTNAPIKTVFYKITLTDGTMITQGQSTDSTGSVPFNVGGSAQDILVTVWSLDNQNEYSAPSWAQVGVTGCDPYTACGTVGGGGSGAGFVFPIWLAFAIIGAVFIVLAGLLGLVWRRITLFPTAVVLIIIGAILLLVAVIAFYV